MITTSVHRLAAALLAWLLLCGTAASQTPSSTADLPAGGSDDRNLKAGTDGVGGIEKAPPTTGNGPMPFPAVPLRQLPGVAKLTQNPWQDLGGALAPPAGRYPLLVGSGGGLAGDALTLTVSDAPPAADTIVVLGASLAELPFRGGLLIPSPDLLIVGLRTDGEGRLLLRAPTPDGLPPDFMIFVQSWHFPAADCAASNAVVYVAP